MATVQQSTTQKVNNGDEKEPTTTTKSPIGKAIEDVTKGALSATGRLLDNAVLIIIVAVLAWGLLGARYALIEYSPSIAKHAGIYAAIVNGIVDGIDLFVFQLRAAIDVIRDLIHLITRRGHMSFPPRPKLDPVTTEGLRTAFTNLPARCSAYAGLAPVVSGASKVLLSDYTCPLIRQTWPIPWLWTLSNAVLGWSSVNAIPPNAQIVDARPGNCENTAYNDLLCIGLGAGYVALEILLPLTIIIAIWTPLLVPIFQFARTVVNTIGSDLRNTSRFIFRKTEEVTDQYVPTIHKKND